ncbi:MAG: lipase [Acidimicrobiaceae bacterium]|nr:lipase [Acidimicrobiaceae bacterium]
MHQAVLSVLPEKLLDLTDISVTRAGLDALMSQMPSPELPAQISVEEAQIPGVGTDPDVPIRIYKPESLPPNAPGLVWIHGGGMVLGSAEMDDAGSAAIAEQHQCVVISVDYRLAPENPYPAPLHDCYAALKWFAKNANSLGVSSDRIAIGGASAGGGLAAGTALMARDKGGPNLIFQLLVFPMLDHRNETPSSFGTSDTRVWNREANIIAWEAYLNNIEPIPSYASPSITDDLSGLPPTYINVGTLDIFVDEDIDYAARLSQAGVPVELHVYPGAFHGSNGFVAESSLSLRWAADQSAALEAALNQRQ